MSKQLDIQRFGGLVGQSPSIRAVYEAISKAARIEVPVLIIGETGTGKELVAREIHLRSARNEGPFVAVNMGALSMELITSELFGHEKGAFTGATESKIGRFEEAHLGTLFLDEIATMEERTQVALLRLLESGEFRPVGGAQDRSADVRIVAATNIDLNHAVARDNFREDLLYRFQVFSIHLPPLRARREDLPLLVEHFLSQVREEFDLCITGISAEALKLLVAFDWPGNIRELKNLLAQAAVLAEQGEIDVQHLPARLHGPSASRESFHGGVLEQPPATPLLGGLHRPAPSPAWNAAVLPDTMGGGFGPEITLPLGLPLEEVQKRYILQTLQECGNNKTQAAKSLELSRKTLYEKLRRWSEA
ncbi:MAG: sigma-54-dependent Fis family transcriptional regulator [Candidatus Hydrogenedentes bacterium]|nr:sigma-54-dependent Fis family transcriptional regulator [Candidatus Hydrogenedentota bacterium]